MRNKALKKLRQAAEEICQEAITSKSKISGSVNWDNLHCVETRVYEDDDGYVEYAVFIKEASPRALKLDEFIRNKLGDRGFYAGDFQYIVVVLDW